VALAALAILAVATAPLAMVVGIAASSAVLVAVVIADTMGEGDHAAGTSAGRRRRNGSRRSRRPHGWFSDT
jgi:hypothetical protein